MQVNFFCYTFKDQRNNINYGLIASNSQILKLFKRKKKALLMYYSHIYSKIFREDWF